MKKLVSLVLVAMLILTAVPLGAFAITVGAETEGYYTYTVTDNEATITAVDVTISGDIILPSTLDGYIVTRVGYGAFKSCAQLTSVTFGDNVRSIGSYAFAECKELTNINMGNKVATIGDYAFYYCSNLVSAPMSDGLTSIGERAFELCKKLTDVIIPDSVVNIGERAFGDCNSITNITIPGSVKNKLGDYAFSGCKNLTAVTFEKGVTNTGYEAFKNCEKLETINFASTVTTISSGSFYSCDGLKELNIPDTVTTINSEAFMNCSNLESVYIGNGVKGIDYGDFSGCVKLESVCFGINIGFISKRAFSNCKALTDVWYRGGSDQDRENIDIDEYNESLNNATWHYNICEEDAHIYLSECDTTCEICDWNRNAEEHSYSYECDPICDLCFETRTELRHTYTNACDIVCNVCYNSEKVITTHTYDDCFEGHNVNYYGEWEMSIEKTGVYTIAPISGYMSTYSIHDIAVFDKQGAQVKYYEKLGGFPLVTGQKYTVKFRYDCSDEISGTVIWNKTKKADKIFPDTYASEWYNNAIAYVVGRNIMSGYGSTGLFGTADNIQRQDFMVMLARLDGVDLSKYVNKTSPFSDVPNSSDCYYKAAVIWGYENGIVSGYANGKFGTGDKITREQLVKFLYNYANYKGLDTSYSASTKQTVKNKYKDYKNVSDWAQDAVLWAIENNVIKGKTDTTIVPYGNALRCEVAQIMYNIFLNDLF